MNVYDAEARVAAGAAWMDANGPEGWLDKIALPYLNINSPHSCVLGQVYDTKATMWEPGYSYAVKNLLRSDYDAAMRLGFNGTTEHEMVVLTETWRRYITAKREELALAA